MTVIRAEQMEFFRPTWRTLMRGSRIYFRYTRNQWMQVWVLRTTRQNLVVEPVPGTVRREISLSWDEVFWQPTS